MSKDNILHYIYDLQRFVTENHYELQEEWMKLSFYYGN